MLRHQYQLTNLYRLLRRNSINIVKDYRSDWRVDRAWLRANFQRVKDNPDDSSMNFVHVTSPTGTHLYHVYQENLDQVRPYLFGRCSFRKTLNDVASMFNSESCFYDAKIIQYFDGNALVIISKSEAHHIFAEAAAYHSPSIH